MSRILKFNLPPVGETRQFHTVGTRILAIGWQGHQLVTWCETPSDGDLEPSVWTVAMTGQDVPEGEYIGTAQLDSNGSLYVVHVYRRRERLA